LVALLTRAQQVLDHVRNDLEEVDSQHDMIDQEIKVKTASVQAEKDQLLEKHQLLEMERDDLLEKLKAKEKEIEACNSEINVKQKEIDKAYVFFERDLRKLKETRERILLDQENRQKEHNDLTLKKMSLEHRKQLLEDQDVKFTDLLSLLDQKILVSIVL
jgi:chromosome segregation ATPase